MLNSMDEVEEKEKLIIKYLGMAYSFDTAIQLADEELELLKPKKKKKKKTVKDIT